MALHMLPSYLRTCYPPNEQAALSSPSPRSGFFPRNNLHAENKLK